MQAHQKMFYLAQGRYERYMRSAGWLGWWPMRARSGSIARNAMYGATVGPELLVDGGIENWTTATKSAARKTYSAATLMNVPMSEKAE